MPGEPSPRSEIAPSQRKLKALSKLEGLAAKLSDGTDYGLHHYVIAGVTLEQVRHDLSVIRNSLADAVVDERAR